MGEEVFGVDLHFYINLKNKEFKMTRDFLLDLIKIIVLAIMIVAIDIFIVIYIVNNIENIFIKIFSVILGSIVVCLVTTLSKLFVRDKAYNWMKRLVIIVLLSGIGFAVSYIVSLKADMYMLYILFLGCFIYSICLEDWVLGSKNKITEKIMKFHNWYFNLYREQKMTSPNITSNKNDSVG